jgi:endonuclease III
MANVIIYKDCDEYVAKMPGVSRQMGQVAHLMGAVAQSVVDAHHMRTPRRFHHNKKPKVVVGKQDVDWYVGLEAWNTARATGIEFGHRYESREKNASGPWNESGGIGALAAAYGHAVAGFGGL